MTTTDPFTEAVHDAGDERYTTPGLRGVFAEGAYWARAHLAAQEPDEAEKDAAMDALGCELRVVENGQSTCDLHGGYAASDDVCEVVEVALSAARAARRDEEKR